MIHNFNADGLDSLYPKYSGGRPPTFTLPQRREIKKIAKSKPAEHGLPLSTWSLTKLADFLVAEGVVDDISHEGLRALLRAENVSFQPMKTWKTSRDPDYPVTKARIEHLYAIADGEARPESGEPEVIFCMDEPGPLTIQPHPGRQWADRGGQHNTSPDRSPRPRRRGTDLPRTHGVRHQCAALDPGADKMHGPIKKRKKQAHQDRQAGRQTGTGQQRRDRLHADQLIPDELNRGPAHRPALPHPRRHRPRQPPRTRQHDPPLHHLAQPSHQRSRPPPSRQQGQRCLTRH